MENDPRELRARMSYGGRLGRMHVESDSMTMPYEVVKPEGSKSPGS